MPGRGTDPTNSQDNSPPVKTPRAESVDEARPLLLPISPENPATSTPIVTVDDLIQVYRSHAKSPLHFLTFKVRASYDGSLSVSPKTLVTGNCANSRKIAFSGPMIAGPLLGSCTWRTLLLGWSGRSITSAWPNWTMLTAL